jgi:MoaA/NifB/PqqE/SkfB family radical SAM enzyme
MSQPTDTLCVLPFIHFNLLANGQASVCCVSNDPLFDEKGRPLNVRTHSLQEIWNSRALRDVRTQMLAGEEPSQCSYCYRAERLYGFGSHRTGQNSLFLAESENQAPSADEGWVRFPKMRRTELKPEMKKPWYFDLRFDNLCNLKCVICFGYASSRIERDPVHFAWTGEKPIERVPNRFGNERRWVRSGILLDELKDISSEVKYIQLAGGEPFLSELALRWLAHLGETGRANKVTLKVFTNLTTFDENVVRLLEPFRFVDLTLSIDGTGSVYEYVRFPGKWQTIETNSRELVNHQAHRLKNTVVNVNATMSVHSASRILDIFEFARLHGFGVTLSNAMDPAYVSTKFLPTGVKKGLLTTLREYAAIHPEFEHLPNQTEQWSAELLSADVSDTEHSEALLNVMRFTNDMDETRDLCFREICPEVYDGYLDECGGWIQETKFAPLKSVKNGLRDNALFHRGKGYPWATRLGGSVEYIGEADAGFTITGWAADERANRAAVSVVATIGDDISALTLPSMARPDIQAGIGNGISPAGFTIAVKKENGRPTKSEPIRLFALTIDNFAVPLTVGKALEEQCSKLVTSALPRDRWSLSLGRTLHDRLRSRSRRSVSG